METAFVDLETTGDNAQIHQIWEAAIVFGDRTRKPVHISMPLTEHDMKVYPLELQEKCHFQERRPELRNIQVSYGQAAPILANALRGCLFVANNPSFDAKFVEVLLCRWGIIRSWHYQLVDIKSMFAGFHGIEPPIKTSDMERMTDIATSGRHTAMGDALWDRDVYEYLLKMAKQRREQKQQAMHEAELRRRGL